MHVDLGRMLLEKREVERRGVPPSKGFEALEPLIVAAIKHRTLRQWYVPGREAPPRVSFKEGDFLQRNLTCSVDRHRKRCAQRRDSAPSEGSMKIGTRKPVWWGG